MTAANFDLPSEVELISTDRYIASVAAGNKLEMEFRIERGKGYKAIDRSREETGGVEFMQIDAVFMPVRKVNYSVENFIDPEGFPKDRLMMEIWTNGSLTAQQAMSEAAALLVDMFNPLKDVTLEPKRDEDTKEEDPTYQIPIEELQLSVRAYNCLKRAQINAVSDLLDYSQEDLLEIKNFGQKSAEEVVEALQIHLGIMLPLEKPAKSV